MREPLRLLGSLTSSVSPAGWTVGGLGVLAAVAGRVGGYVELQVLAVLCGLVLLVSLVLLVVAPGRVEAKLELRPASTVAGTPGRALLRVTNRGRWSVRHPVVTVPVRAGAVVVERGFVRLPRLRPGVQHQEEVVLPAMERGIVQVGPVGARRTDPLGLFRRDRDWTGVADLAVRPRMTPIETMAPGHVPDHDGTPSEEVSMSDLAFHALREYVPGDDLRHVHWRSSARAGVLHVRQYHDTRRSHVVIVVDRHEESYPRAQDFELALSIATSVAVRLTEEGYTLTFVCGPDVGADAIGVVLDASCRAVLGPDDLEESARTASRMAPGSSQLVVVSGVLGAPQRVQGCRAAFADDVRFLGLATGRVPGESRDDPPRDLGAGPARMLRVRRMAELPGVLAASVLGEGR
ncbi:DUF58 domain-containing protein [Nocardioides dongxiaopingii]|uniref:DUF58 domain-containing protein n=1 Tax=Nocardioides sp. S-1144 TaxID=2582905 RepID=UPI00110E7E56|nr:DUF58 domain-containing protein [Nocardioides sp. S-1144]QCW50474.1 DUF58 domain-containing protein [Nocardioides sp. S-1144]